MATDTLNDDEDLDDIPDLIDQAFHEEDLNISSELVDCLIGNAMQLFECTVNGTLTYTARFTVNKIICNIYLEECGDENGSKYFINTENGSTVFPGEVFSFEIWASIHKSIVRYYSYKDRETFPFDIVERKNLIGR